MRKLLFILLLFVSANIFAQSFGFEDAEIPSQWTSSASGNLSLSTEHYKEGVQSLCWTATGATTLTATFTSFIASTGNSAYLQIYSPEITFDTLTVDFLYNTTVKKKAIYLINYKGWHEFNRAYTEYASTLSNSITSVRFTLKPTSGTTARKIYFDAVEFNHTNDSKRIIGSHWVLDKKYFNSTADTSSLSLFGNVIDIPVSSPTAQELTDLSTLRTLLKRSPSAGSTTDLDAAKTYVASLNIVRNSDGSVHGNAIDCSATALTDAFMTDIANKVEILAAASQTDAATKVIFQNFVDHLLDQGISEGCNFRTFSNSYTTCKVVPAAWLDAMQVCSTDQKDEILKLVKWFSFYGTLYYPQNIYLANLVSDIIYLFTPHMLAIALNQTSDDMAVRELKAFKRYMDRNTEYVPGGGDILKSDGTGFHHNTHYNNYMYAYKTWIQYLYYIRGTQFRIAPESYQRLKKAIISYYIMSTLDTGDNRYFANTLSGRKPFDTSTQFSKSLFDNLIDIGTDCLGQQDDELAAAYNYFFKTTKYTAPVQNYEGFYQFNYSPTGIYRQSNWVATMHAPTSEFWGSEIYDNTNRFGRYQSHGSLEILYSGTLASNGYASSSSASGGWDWNIVPGATVVQYASWQEMMPYKSVTGRFDQYTLSKNFSGALSFGDCGIFATDFDQIDKWSSSAFTATNLVFKKSVFAFDNMLISVGSSITSSGSYSTSMITSTNLFQCLNPATIGNTILNGTTISLPYNATVSTAIDNWIITPQGTGYFIPKGNDALEVRFANQSTPVYTGADYDAPTTTVPAVKAYLNHGVKPTSAKSYSFVVIPGTNTTEMQSLATQLANAGGSIYQILSQSSAYHALWYKPANTYAYSFFGAVSSVTAGIVKSVSSECLFMDKYDATLNRHQFAICNPNLNPQTDDTYGWISTPVQTTITLNGEWKSTGSVSGVTFSEPANNQTSVTISLNDGEPKYFGAMLLTDTSVKNTDAENTWVNFSASASNLIISFREPLQNSSVVRIFDTTGKAIFSKDIQKGIQESEIKTNNIKSGIYLCSIVDGTRYKTFKFSL